MFKCIQCYFFFLAKTTFFLLQKKYFFFKKKVTFFCKRKYFFLQKKVTFFCKKKYFFLPKKSTLRTLSMERGGPVDHSAIMLEQDIGKGKKHNRPARCVRPNHTSKKRVMWRGWLFWQNKIGGKFGQKWPKMA